VKPDQKRSQLLVYWDGKCPLCAEIKSRFVGFDLHHRLVFLDFRNPKDSLTAASRFTAKELAEEMRVKMPDGSWRTGFFAWAAIFSAMPPIHWLGDCMRCWLFADIGPKAYRWVAKNRFEISRLLRLPDPCDPSGACGLDGI
jgi:predicted DCC family thiol-disulfide oxidoreductase YuxK